jgi:hypothetical protein
MARTLAAIVEVGREGGERDGDEYRDDEEGLHREIQVGDW